MAMDMLPWIPWDAVYTYGIRYTPARLPEYCNPCHLYILPLLAHSPSASTNTFTLHTLGKYGSTISKLDSLNWITQVMAYITAVAINTIQEYVSF